MNQLVSTELLAPAGSFEKLQIVLEYGADAVYIGGQKFGLRAAADNFTDEEMREGVELTHSKGSKLFVVINSYLHDSDLEELPEFICYLEKIGVDAVIVSDLGVIETIKQWTNLEIHLSTQASCLNIESAKLWKQMGVTRLVLGREVTLAEAKMIKQEADIEIEMFIHGSMCMAYSGQCTISNYTQGRDSNRGGCAHSCRFEYSLEYQNLEKKKSFFMSSKDLNGLEVIEDFLEAGIDSLKIEGRMKGHLYASTVTKVYREALDSIASGDKISDELSSEFLKLTHRDYFTGSLIQEARAGVYEKREHDNGAYEVAGIIQEVVGNEFLVVEVRKFFEEGAFLELIAFKGVMPAFRVGFIKDLLGAEIKKTKPGTLVKIPYIQGAKALMVLRSKKDFS